MIRFFKNFFNKRAKKKALTFYAQALYPILVKDYSGGDWYTEGQIQTALKKQENESLLRFIKYAKAMFLNPEQSIQSKREKLRKYMARKYFSTPFIEIENKNYFADKNHYISTSAHIRNDSPNPNIISSYSGSNQNK